MEVDELRVGKQKLQRRLLELKDEAVREASLRSSLEESHNALLDRIKDMEELVEKEREEVNMETHYLLNII